MPDPVYTSAVEARIDSVYTTVRLSSAIWSGLSAVSAVPSNIGTTFVPGIPTFIVLGATSPGRPCDTAGGCAGFCRGATVSVSGNPGTNGGSVSYFVNNTFTGTNNGGLFTFTNLCGNTTYAITVQNSFSLRSVATSVTTPQYV